MFNFKSDAPCLYEEVCNLVLACEKFAKHLLKITLMNNEQKMDKRAATDKNALITFWTYNNIKFDL